MLYAVILLAQLPGKKVTKRRKLAREKRGRNSADSLIFATTALKGYPSRHFGLFLTCTEKLRPEQEQRLITNDLRGSLDFIKKKHISCGQ
jgi:hypothetical protein